jgi:histone deacetylase 11
LTATERPNRRTFLIAFACLSAGGWAFQSLSKEQQLSGNAAEINKTGLVPLIYSDDYNISAFGLEYLNPFDGHKYSKIQKHLIHSRLRISADFIKPLEISKDQLLTVHTEKYLDSLKDAHVLAKIFEVSAAPFIPIPLLDWRILQPMRLASGGTLMACRLALQNGLAINLSGGYHHADQNHGEGFCCYSDVPIALKLLKQEGKLGQALIIDTDAHQGNGFANVLRDTNWGHVLDLFDESVFPFPKVLEDISVPLPEGTNGQDYLKALRKHVPEAITKFNPDLIVYNAGSDVLASDPLSSLLVSPAQMCERDLYVVSQARNRGIPLAMVLSGGYSKESAATHAQSIESILRKYDHSLN